MGHVPDNKLIGYVCYTAVLLYWIRHNAHFSMLGKFEHPCTASERMKIG